MSSLRGSPESARSDPARRQRADRRQLGRRGHGA